LANNLGSVKAEMMRQQKTNAALVQDIQTKETNSVKKGQTRLSVNEALLLCERFV
jgi:hypothetical protein